MPAAKRGRGVASEVALARRDSPARGGRHLGFAKALVHEMPHTLAALECGALSEWRATLIVREAPAWMSRTGALLDAELCGDLSKLDGMGDARVAAAAKEIAYRLDAQAVVDRAAKAEAERTVTIRPAPDTMTYVTALLPVAQGVGVYAALSRAADTTFDGRSRGQVMADTLVERVTGRPADVADSGRGQPGALGRDAVGRGQRAGCDRGLRADSGGGGARDWWRARWPTTVPSNAPAALRVIPRSGALVAMESRSRLFPKRPGRFHRAARPDTVARPTAMPRFDIATTPNPGPKAAIPRRLTGSGRASAATTPKKPTGWRVRTGIDENHTHTAEFTTPTGTRYRSGAPPRAPAITISDVEVRVGIAIARHAA